MCKASVLQNVGTVTLGQIQCVSTITAPSVCIWMCYQCIAATAKEMRGAQAIRILNKAQDCCRNSLTCVELRFFAGLSKGLITVICCGSDAYRCRLAPGR